MSLFFLEKVFNAAAAAAAAAPTVAPPGTAEISRPRRHQPSKGRLLSLFRHELSHWLGWNDTGQKLRMRGVGGVRGLQFCSPFFPQPFFFFIPSIPETLGAGFPLPPLTISRLLLLLLLSLLSGSDGTEPSRPAERTGIRMVAARRVQCGKSVSGAPRLSGKTRLLPNWWWNPHFFHPSPHRRPPPPAPTTSDRNPRRHPREDVSMSVFVGLPRQSCARWKPFKIELSGINEWILPRGTRAASTFVRRRECFHCRLLPLSSFLFFSSPPWHWPCQDLLGATGNSQAPPPPPFG